MEEIFSKYPENLLEIISDNQPIEKRMFAARGLLPLPPSDLVKVLFAFSFDNESQIKEAALESLKEIPVELILPVLSDVNAIPEILDFISKSIGNSEYNQAILLNPSTSDETFIYLAECETSQPNLEIIASNKQRILRSVDIVDALSKNPALSRSVMDEVLSFLFLHLQKSDDVKDFINRINTESDKKIEIEDIVEENTDLDDITESFFDNIDLPKDFIDELEDIEDVSDDGDDENQEKIVSKEGVLQRLQKLNMAEKLKTALLGNTEARRILVRDPNKVISSAVLRNPRISESEVITISQSKVVDDDILRQISETKKWVKLYQVKLSLVNNPKTPTHISLNLLRHLREHDMKALMFNRNLPGAVMTGARNIYKSMKK